MCACALASFFVDAAAALLLLSRKSCSHFLRLDYCTLLDGAEVVCMYVWLRLRYHYMHDQASRVPSVGVTGSGY
jgi:hypothetical protein